MTYEQIETFLTVVSRGSVTAAASALFVTQSTVSSRIQGLENEIGATLLIRAKGHRGVELTSYGQAFVPIAGQWTSLWKRTQQLKDGDDTKALTIAGADSICNYTLVRLFKAHVERHPEIRLRIRTHHSYEIQGLVQNRMADIGFVFSRIQYPNVISRPVYRELLHLLCRKDGPFHEGMDCADLDPADEVFISWSHDYQQWHDRHWEPERHPAVAVNTGSMLQRFLDSPKRWAVAPMSVIEQLSRKGELTYYRLKTPPPPRICYELRNRHPTLGQQQAIDTFNEELEAFVATNPDICVFEGWMLEDERSREKRKRSARGEKSGKMGR